MEEIYRTKVPEGWFRQLSSIHLHIDGAGTTSESQHIIKDFERSGAAVKFTHITAAIAGPQRLDYPETYRTHTPGNEGREDFDYFSTIRFGNYEATIEALRVLLPRLDLKAGVVVEAEQVVGVISKEGKWSGSIKPQVPVINPLDVGFECVQTQPIEIHHGFNVPKQAMSERTSHPIDLEVLINDCTNLDIRLGGWFLFEKRGEWAFRSNMFAEANVSSKLISEHRAKLNKYLARYTFCSPVWTIVEYVLGVWKTPLVST